MELDTFVKQYPTLDMYSGNAEEKIKALIDEYHHALNQIVACFELQDGNKKMPGLTIFMNGVKEILNRGAPIVRAGSPLAIINGMFAFAEERCGHNPFSAVHALSTIIDYVDILEHELNEYYFAENEDS